MLGQFWVHKNYDDELSRNLDLSTIGSPSNNVQVAEEKCPF